MKSKRAWLMGTLATGTVVAATVVGSVSASTNVYPPYVEKFAQKFSLKTEEVQNLYDEVAQNDDFQAGKLPG